MRTQTGESQMASYKECRHVMPTGIHCQSPAMRGCAFCYFHARAVRPARPIPPLEARIEMPPTLGRDKILGALNQVIQALAANRITARRAAVLLQGIQMASGQNFPAPPECLSSLFPGNPEPHPQPPRR
jgi:hypothetical protein